MNLIEKYDFSRSEWEKIIDEWIFNEVHRKMLKRRLLDGLCYDDLADEFNLSPERIRKIIYKAKERLYKHI